MEQVARDEDCEAKFWTDWARKVGKPIESVYDIGEHDVLFLQTFIDTALRTADEKNRELNPA